MTLYDLLKQHCLASAQASDWQACTDKLNAPSQTSPITELRTTSWLIRELSEVVDPATGATEADVVLGTLQASNVPRVKEALTIMAGNGIDLSDPQVQRLIDVLSASGNWPVGLADRIKAAGFDSRSLAQMNGLPEVTPVTAQSHWETGQAVEAGSVTYDNRRILLCLNDGPVNDSLTIRYTPVGVVGGVEVKGASTNSGGVSSGLNGRDAQLYTDLLAAVSKWEAS